MRLVDADALKAKAFGKRGGLIHTSDIDAAPTVDAVPVVRCKDCKHYRPYAGIADGYCRMAEWYKRYQYENDFCSRGERKDGEQA